MGIQNNPKMMTLDEVAEYLRIHKSTLYRMAREGQIPASKVANQWRFRKEALDRWLAQKEAGNSSTHRKV